MSVIPFIIQGQNRTVVENRRDFDSQGGVDSQVILMHNIDKQQLDDSRRGNATYDLRVGDEYRDHRDSNKRGLADGGTIRLHAGSAVIVETVEFVHFPKSRFGHIVPRVSLLQDGLSNTSSKIDPGYNGRLSITVFNLGNRDVVLEKGQRFCTLYVLDVADGIVPYDKPPKQIPSAPRMELTARVRDYIQSNGNYFVVISVIVNIIVLIYQLFF